MAYIIIKRLQHLALASNWTTAIFQYCWNSMVKSPHQLAQSGTMPNCRIKRYLLVNISKIKHALHLQGLL